MSLSPGDVKDLLTLGLLSPLQDSDAIPVERAAPPLQMTPLLAVKKYIASSQGSVRFYGGLQGKPAAGQVLFEILMVGDEVFDAGLPASLLGCDTAPTGTVSLAISVNGVSVGTGGINANVAGVKNPGGNFGGGGGVTSSNASGLGGKGGLIAKLQALGGGHTLLLTGEG